MHGKPYTAADIRKIETLMRKGWSQARIADHMGRSHGSISQAVAQHSRVDGRALFIDRTRGVTLCQVAQAKRLIVSGRGMSAAQAAKALGVSVRSLRRQLKRQGWCPIAHRIAARRKHVARLTKAGKTQVEIAAALGVSPVSVANDQRWLRSCKLRAAAT